MKTWFITGASRGFGARVAELALTKGDNVVATARRATDIAKRFGEKPNLLAAPLDVTNEAQARAAAALAVERFGRIDVLLNNAGVGLLGAVEEATTAEIEALYRTNVFGVLAVTRAVLPTMRAWTCPQTTTPAPHRSRLRRDGECGASKADVRSSKPRSRCRKHRTAMPMSS